MLNVGYETEQKRRLAADKENESGRVGACAEEFWVWGRLPEDKKLKSRVNPLDDMSQACTSHLSYQGTRLFGLIPLE